MPSRMLFVGQARKILLPSISAILILLPLPVSMVGWAAPVSQVLPVWDPRIAIVWPHDASGNPAPLEHSQAVNISVWPAPYSGSCTSQPPSPIVLYEAKNNEPAQPVSVRPRFTFKDVGGSRFPALEFDNIPADLARDPSARYSFFANFYSNVWVHSVDARTSLPTPVVPTGVTGGIPLQVDTRIQVVWPHDEHGQLAPVSEAPLVNIAVDIFAHGTLQSVRPDFPFGPIVLLVAQANDPLRIFPQTNAPKTPVEIIDTGNGQTFPRWVFNDVPVLPGVPYHFVVQVLGPVQTFSTVWTHAVDARTILPTPQPPFDCPGWHTLIDSGFSPRATVTETLMSPSRCVPIRHSSAGQGCSLATSVTERTPSAFC